MVVAVTSSDLIDWITGTIDRNACSADNGVAAVLLFQDPAALGIVWFPFFHNRFGIGGSSAVQTLSSQTRSLSLVVAVAAPILSLPRQISSSIDMADTRDRSSSSTQQACTTSDGTRSMS